LANTTALSTFFASPAVKIHQIKKHVLFNSRPLQVICFMKRNNAPIHDGRYLGADAGCKKCWRNWVEK
ncbi:MAG: hypothetical protein ACI9G6_002945, partial [Limisphaerales bacterium]